MRWFIPASVVEHCAQPRDTNNILSPGTPFDRSAASNTRTVSDFDFTLDEVLLLRTVAEAYRELGQAMRADAPRDDRGEGGAGAVADGLHVDAGSPRARESRVIRALWNRFVSAILDAQQVIGPVDDSDTLAPALASPDLVGALVARDQHDAQYIASRPVRSTKADAKRAALQYAEHRAGRPLTWKSARKLLSQWERLDRAN